MFRTLFRLRRQPGACAARYRWLTSSLADSPHNLRRYHKEVQKFRPELRTADSQTVLQLFRERPECTMFLTNFRQPREPCCCPVGVRVIGSQSLLDEWTPGVDLCIDNHPENLAAIARVLEHQQYPQDRRAVGRDAELPRTV